MEPALQAEGGGGRPRDAAASRSYNGRGNRFRLRASESSAAADGSAPAQRDCPTADDKSVLSHAPESAVICHSSNRELIQRGSGFSM